MKDGKDSSFLEMHDGVISENTVGEEEVEQVGRMAARGWDYGQLHAISLGPRGEFFFVSLPRVMSRHLGFGSVFESGDEESGENF